MKSIIVGLALAGAIYAGPIAGGECSDGTAAEYNALGAAGCTVFTGTAREQSITNMVFAFSATGGMTAPNLADVLVHVEQFNVVNETTFRMDFNFSPALDIPSNSSLTLTGAYDVSLITPGTMHYHSARVSPDVFGPNAAPNTVHFDITAGTRSVSATATNTTGTGFDLRLPRVSPERFGFHHAFTVELATGPGGSLGDIDYISSSVNAKDTAFLAPEPSSVTLAGFGLLALAIKAVRYRWRRRIL